MAFQAQRRLRWGDGYIEPGEAVPEEEGRNYASLLALGHIVEVKATEEMSDEELKAHADELQKEVDDFNERMAELEGGDGATPAPEVEVPEDVTPGVTAGWPLDATTGDPLALTDEQRTEMVEKGILPEGTEAEPVEGIVTHQGELVLISGGPAVDEALAEGEGEAEETEAPAESESESESEGDVDAGDGKDTLPEGVKAEGGGWYVLPDGTKVQGRKAVDEALAAS